MQAKNSESPDLRCMVSSIGPIFFQTQSIPSLLCMGTDFSPFKYFLMINQPLTSTHFFTKQQLLKNPQFEWKLQQTRLGILNLSMNLTKFLQTEQKQKAPN